jgi:hypothetical protein
MPAKKTRRWIQQALGVKRRMKPGTHEYRVLPAHPGALHKQLGVPAGQKIPVATLRAAAKMPGTLGKRARLALTLRSFRATGKRRSRRS